MAVELATIDPGLDLFVYGTLLFPEVLMALLGRVPVGVPATPAGWRVAALPGQVYPGLVPAAGGVANGHLVGGLSRAERLIVASYETADYELVRIELADGRGCLTYRWHGPVLAHDWDRHLFAAHHLAAQVARCALGRSGTDRPV